MNREQINEILEEYDDSMALPSGNYKTDIKTRDKAREQVFNRLEQQTEVSDAEIEEWTKRNPDLFHHPKFTDQPEVGAKERIAKVNEIINKYMCLPRGEKNPVCATDVLDEINELYIHHPQISEERIKEVVDVYQPFSLPGGYPSERRIRSYFRDGIEAALTELNK